ncbi:MAG: NAD(P)/FAD-dependent oxidoreductase [Lachnospiraceae bacterium]|nr:NAD(P)/FAD-dependent oxidoreductase [Lachnospiraceae bacterium]
MPKVVVIGGGAAGMMAAISAAERGAEVTLLEKNERLGKKLYITGKGRCNVTNACDREDFFANVVTNSRFMYSAYSQWSNWDMMDYLESLGLPLKTERGNRVFPVSDKSSDVIRTLARALERAGVKVCLNTAVRELLFEEDAVQSENAEQSSQNAERSSGKKAGASARCTGVRLASGEEIPADAVVVATGGLSYPSTGSTGDGYLWAKEAGHSVSDRFPALVPFDALLPDGHPCKELQGLALKNVGMQVFCGEKRLAGDFGELLFTHFGVSGPLVLSAGSVVTAAINAPNAKEAAKETGAQAKNTVWRMVLDLKPALSEEQLDRRILRELESGANKQMKNVLGSLFPAKLVPVMLRLSGIPGELCGREVTRQQRQQLLTMTKSFPIKLLGTRSFAEAIITQGGISVREINPKTMESKRMPGLYFAGEVLDVDAFTGGYNLQIAWSTGRAAGLAAAEAAASISE